MEKRNTIKMVDILLALIIGFILFAPDNVFASHWTWAHTRYMHPSNSTYNETACVDTSASTMNFTIHQYFRRLARISLKSNLLRDEQFLMWVTKFKCISRNASSSLRER